MLLRFLYFGLLYVKASGSDRPIDIAKTTKFISHDEAELKKRDRTDPAHPTLDSHTSLMTQQVEQLFRTHAYEMSVRPSRNDEPVVVGVAILVESISDISEVNMDLTFTLRIWKSWTDERLALHGGHESIVLPSRLIDKLWVPDLFVVGSKKSFIHRTTVDNMMLRLYRNGTISYKAKITTTVACQMNLYNFPLDIENCTLAVQSLAYTDDEVILKWLMDDNDDIFMDPKLISNLPKFKLVHYKLHAKNISDKQGGGNVSQLRVSFELKRYLLSVFFLSYFPAIIMVVLAGFGMWLDPTSVPARVSLGVTALLTVTTIITGLKSSFPKVSYLTAMDLYLWICFLFVFGSIVEYSFLNSVMTKQKKKEIKRLRQQQQQQQPTSSREKFTETNGTNANVVAPYNSYESVKYHRSHIYKCDDDSVGYRTNFSCHKASVTCTRRKPQYSRINSIKRNVTIVMNHDYDATNMDKLFRIIYFSAFMLFNAGYWSYYVISTQHAANDEN